MALLRRTTQIDFRSILRISLARPSVFTDNCVATLMGGSMSKLILSCAKTGRLFNSGFPVSQDDLRFTPPKLTARFHCGPCGRIHEFEFAAARVCDCAHECPYMGECQNCEFATRVAAA
jgi:hypothetical protein